MRASRLREASTGALLLLSITIMVLPMLGLLLPLVSASSLSEVGAASAFPFSSRQMTLLARSVLFSAVVAMVTTIAGAALALALQRGHSRRTAVAVILPALIVTPPAIHAINWTVTLMTVGSWLNGRGRANTLSNGWFAAGLAETLSFLPVAIGVAWAGFSMLDARLVEAGRVYRSEWAVLAAISARLALPVLMSGAGVVFLLSLSDYAVPSLFSVNVFALEVFSTYSSGIHPSAAVWTAAPLMAVVAITLIATLRIGRRAEALARSRQASSQALDRGAGSGLGAVALLLLYFLLPLGIMAATARSWGSLTTAADGARSEGGVTFIIALSTAMLCVLLGMVTGRAMDENGPISAMLWLVTCLAFALPAPLTGIGILQLGGSASWLEEGLPVWACTARFLPMAALLSFALRRRADHGLIEAGHVFARSRGHALGRVTLPLMLPGLVVLGATCFAFSVGELGATLLVASPGHATLMMRLYNLLHYGASSEAAALCLLLTLPALAAGALATLFLRRGPARIVAEPDHA